MFIDEASVAAVDSSLQRGELYRAQGATTTSCSWRSSGSRAIRSRASYARVIRSSRSSTRSRLASSPTLVRGSTPRTRRSGPDGQPLGIVHRDISPPNTPDLAARPGEGQRLRDRQGAVPGPLGDEDRRSERQGSLTSRRNKSRGATWIGAPTCTRWAARSTSPRSDFVPSAAVRKRSPRSWRATYRKPREVDPDYRSRSRTSCFKALANDREQRFQSADEMQDGARGSDPLHGGARSRTRTSRVS